MPFRWSLSLLLLLSVATGLAHAGLYYSGETYAELPSRWQGFLLDQRSLRQAAVENSPVRKRYLAAAEVLQAKPKLSAEEAADLGALYIRLGDSAKALAVLRVAQKAHPADFRLTANLGTAWQLHGDLTQAAVVLEQAVRLAPAKHLKAEELHLKLVRQRARQIPGTQTLDDLFGIRYVGPTGKYQPGTLAEEQRKRLPVAAIGQVQQLALWLPGDARLLWQLGELAGAAGDVATAAAIMDGCVSEFGLRDPELAARRKLNRAAAEEKKEHDEHALAFKPRSSRPLLTKQNTNLPAIDPKAFNPLAWEVVYETTVDRQARPTFARYLRELDGKKVRLTGYQQPLGDDTDLLAFLLVEHPVGCWWCEMPELTGMVLVELPEGKSTRRTRELLRIEGTLKLNANDPENFLYLLQDASVREEGEK